MASAGLRMPGPDRLPPGPLRDLVEAVHELYRGAGKPSLRKIAEETKRGDYRDTVSHEKVRAILRGEGLPRWFKLEAMVRVLAEWHTPRRDADAEAARIQPFWHLAQGDVVASRAGTGDTGAADGPRLGSASFSVVDLPVGGNVLAEDADVVLGAATTSEARRTRPAVTDRWQATLCGTAAALTSYVGQIQMDHPGYTARTTEAQKPDSTIPTRIPAVRIGTVITCDALPVSTPGTSQLRSSFRDFLGQPAITRLVTALTNPSREVSWRSRGDYMRNTVGAVLTRCDEDEEPPVAWAKLVFPDAAMTSPGRDPRQAGFTLYIEPRSPDGAIAPAIALSSWPVLMADALRVATGLARFLTDRLQLATYDDPGTCTAIWLTDLRSLVDPEDATEVQGGISSSSFAGYAVADRAGDPPVLVAQQLVQHLADVMSLDGYEHLLLSSGKTDEHPQPQLRRRTTTNDRRLAELDETLSVLQTIRWSLAEPPADLTGRAVALLQDHVGTMTPDELGFRLLRCGRTTLSTNPQLKAWFDDLTTGLTREQATLRGQALTGPDDAGPIEVVRTPPNLSESCRPELVTLLQGLVDDAAGDAVPVTTLLRRLKNVALATGAAPLADWVRHELEGYPAGADLPTYRGPFPATVYGHFVGLGMEWTGVPIAPSTFPPDQRRSPLFEISLVQPVAGLEHMARNANPLHSEWSADTVRRYNIRIARNEIKRTMGKGTKLVQAVSIIEPRLCTEALDAVRTRILDLAHELKKATPPPVRPTHPPRRPSPHSR